MDQTTEVRDGMDALRRIVRALRVSARAAERDHGVSGAQLFVLQQLEDAPASSLRELAQRTATDQSSVSVVVARLVERGLVARQVARADARRSEIAITGAGRALIRRAPEAAPGRLLDAMTSLPVRVRRPLTRGLVQLATALEASGAAPPMFFEEETARARPARRRRSDAR